MFGSRKEAGKILKNNITEVLKVIDFVMLNFLPDGRLGFSISAHFISDPEINSG